MPKPDLGALVDLYLDHVRVERGLAPNTVESYGRDLSSFVEYTESAGLSELEDVGLEHVAAWQRRLARRGLGARSVARHLSSLRGLYKFHLREGSIEADPTSLAARPRSGRKLPRPLTESEIARLIAAPDAAKPRGARDRAMLSLAYAAGLRASEIIGLGLGDVDLERGVVAAYGKGKKRRLVPIGEVALDHLDAYLAVRPDPAPGGRADRASRVGLFLSTRRRPMTRQSFWKIVKKHAARAGLADRVHPHQLRHSFATHLLAGGADLRSVQTMLGHASVVTTEVYTHVTPGRVRSVHRETHPRG